MRRNKIERNNPVVLSQGEYDIKAGVPRILRLLKKHGLKAAFFVPGEVAEKYPETVKSIVREGHEIGHHGYAHRNMANCTLAEEKEDLEKGFNALRDIAGQRPVGYRAAATDMSTNTLDLLTEYGLTYDSTMMDSDLPYVIKTKAGAIVELPMKWLLDDWVHFGFNYFPPLEYQSGVSSHRKVLEIWADEFSAVHQEGLYYMLVMHPQLIGVPSRAMMLDNLISGMKRFGKEVWFATPSEVARYWMERAR